MEAGLNVVEAGHFATETVVLPVLKEKLSASFPNVVFEIAKSNCEPYYAV
jgi:putative NIF3 family GTP cyclohydrolase 1 type 2